MRTRRVFTPVVDFMPVRIAPSVTGLAQVATASSADSPTSNLPPGVMPQDTPQSYPKMAGEPTPSPVLINC
jgi:hypothetical protein